MEDDVYEVFLSLNVYVLQQGSSELTPSEAMWSFKQQFTSDGCGRCSESKGEGR